MIGVSDIIKEIGSSKGVTNIISVITGGGITNMLPWRAFNPVWFVLTFLGFIVFMFLFGILIQHSVLRIKHLFNILIAKWIHQHG